MACVWGDFSWTLLTQIRSDVPINSITSVFPGSFFVRKCQARPGHHYFLPAHVKTTTQSMVQRESLAFLLKHQNFNSFSLFFRFCLKLWRQILRFKYYFESLGFLIQQNFNHFALFLLILWLQITIPFVQFFRFYLKLWRLHSSAGFTISVIPIISQVLSI